ncbi:MAG TPA: type IV secretory system conjugative DNA transfer family protein [Terriglobia bacterium]|nr:type IV secretory system conjugative DNA transfer family protein [Terriglobia bacterium]
MTRTPWADARRVRRYLPLVLILYLCPASALAQVPDATIQSIVNLNVKTAEIRYLYDSGQIDETTWRARGVAIDSDMYAEWRVLTGYSPAEQNQAKSQINGLTKLRLETLQPGWDAKIAVAKSHREQHEHAVNDAIPTDARAALELQRRRLSLQQRRDSGEIKPEEFAVEDKKAIDGIMALRNKYVSEGQDYAARFDWQLAQLTQGMEKNPAIPPSAPDANAVQGNATQGGTSADDYKRDVARAIDISSRVKQLSRRHEKKEIDDATYRESSNNLNADLMSLLKKWRAVGRGNEFWKDYLQPDVDAAVAAEQAKPAPGGTSEADYKHDVALASDLLSQLANARDPKTYRNLDAGLARLYEKWSAVGRGHSFQHDYQQPLSDANAAAQSRAQTSVGHGGVLLGFLGFFVLLPIAGFVGFYLLIRLLSKRTPAKGGVSDVYGTAHYASVLLDVVDDTCLASGVFFGKSSAPELARLPLEAPGAPVCSTPEHHTLIVARTRTGKGTRVIVPTLLYYGGSAFVIDPKGENAAVTARVRRDQLHQNIHILNPWNELGETFPSRSLASATYNPLDILDRSDPNAVAVAQTLAGAICPAPTGGKDSYWHGSAANMLTAVFLWLAYWPEERKTLGRAREIVSLSRKDFTQKFLVPMAASEAFSGAIREMAAPFIDLAPETYSGVMSNLSEKTKFLSDPQVKASTAKSSFSMEDLVTHKCSVYVVIPTERMDAQKTWLRLVVASAMHTFKRPRKRDESRHRCLFLIDEFAALGRVEELPRDIATMGGFGVDFVLVVQGLDQLKDHYGDARNTILSNCAYKWFCNLNDLESAEYLSKTLGKKTVETTSTSDSSSSHGGSSSTSHGETARNLLNADEILNLGKDVAIVIQPKDHPHYVRPVDYWALPKAFGYLRQGHPSLYWEPPFIYDENPYFAPLGSDGNGAKTEEKAQTEPSPV